MDRLIAVQNELHPKSNRLDSLNEQIATKEKEKERLKGYISYLHLSLQRATRPPKNQLAIVRIVSKLNKANKDLNEENLKLNQLYQEKEPLEKEVAELRAREENLEKNKEHYKNELSECEASNEDPDDEK